MSINNIELLAAYWTIAGDTYPGAATEFSPHSLQARAEAASKAGWRGMGLVHADILHTVERHGISTVRNIFKDNGIKHLEVEFLIDWHLSGERRTASDRICMELLEAAGELNARNIKVAGGLFDEDAPDIEAMREHFAVLCDKAKPFGVNVVVEFLPFSSINTIDRALALTKDVRPNGGILIDTWHVARGGMSNDEIQKIPTDLIKSIELNDAAKEVNGTLFNDSTHYRKLCGEGDLDVTGFIQNVVDAGYQGPWGVEVISAELRKLPLEVAAKRAFDTTIAQFEQIRFPKS
ncbi:sugar phosphate isomerase/epimerase [Pseudomonas daroniae]|uniref:Sugar phosphate isomerase/epimerase n=1 Tax=Phytopseudomonas daroniae TaxID=2487519 RepID=A0A4Q9QP98_9GAMM|nr:MULTISPECIES: sugar phosphate isomerase/epimerase [Pseudomonas]TBU74656.1 sugar phosphate isomerase/epimerase [Pseudomonas daroniae]TBU82043.1 sugar phosphate isomerase/epimerase [Pseudomonas daroniae]TBU84621.1 sugar phosphate isomerase/epimerase [Pseudomonas sp. FRB 228]TBU92344.1 sugar phosphate isomerase/epimerase [Pseudomonas daroniae]